MSLNLDPEEETLIPEAEKPAAKKPAAKKPTCKINWWFWCCCNDCAKCVICFNGCIGRETVVTT